MKKYLKQNKTLFILMFIAISCIIISTILLFKYFYFGNGGTKYGSRLDGIEAVEINDSKKNEIATNIESDELVEKATVTITGKIIYIKIIYTNKATMTDAETIAVKSLDNFSEEEKAFYDFQFIIEQKADETTEGFLKSGAKNVNGTNLVWSNNNATTSTEVKE